MDTLKYALNKHPIIISVTDYSDINTALQAKNSNIIIIVNSDINTIKNIVDKVKETNKIVFVHVDLMKGLKRDSPGIQFLARQIGIDGIVTTNTSLIKIAKRLNLLTIQRIFILDTASIKQGIKSVRDSQPDAVEILPGIIVPHIQKEFHNNIKVPIIAAGLINTYDRIENVLEKGADGVSTSSSNIW